MKIHCISHITFRCTDLEKTSHMLKVLFDAQEIYSSDAHNFSLSREKFFDVAGIWIAIMEGEAIEKSYNHIAFKVNALDLPIFTQKIIELGLKILPSRARCAAEGESVYFYDYDNHLFELHSGDLQTRLAFYKTNKTKI